MDLYLSCFGPALEEFSRHWPIKRGQPQPIEEKTKKRGRAQLTLEELFERGRSLRRHARKMPSMPPAAR